VRLLDVIPFGANMAIARIEVVLDDDLVLRYQLPLAVRAQDALAADAPRAVLAEIETKAGRALLFDATEDAEFRAALGRAFEMGASFGQGATRFVVEPIEGSASCFPLPESRLGSAEQSNTSILYGDRAILKLFRRLEPGMNPDVEIGRFLTARAHFPHTPALLGTARIEGADGASIAGMLQRFMPGSVDAWHHVLETGRADFATNRSSGDSSGDSSRDSSGNAVARDAERLGAVTRALHEALASDTRDPDFAPEPASDEDVARWAASTRESVAHAAKLAASSGRASELGDERRYGQLVGEIERAVRGDAGARIRHHGDYHLGQVLRTAEGEFMVIDFEGEPARPLVERRRKHNALRDVAGMLRSFGYAAATLASSAGGEVDEARLERWEGEARDAFLRGYFGAGDRSSFLPRTRESADALIRLFEIEKVFYELAYELDNRPDWSWIPRRGIQRLTSERRDG
jgi:maltose alpha-D-glucosyltransferase/alpha-amylase